MSRVRIKTLSLWSEHCVAVDVRITSLRVKVSRQCNHFGFEIAFDQMDLKRKYLIFSLVLILGNHISLQHITMYGLMFLSLKLPKLI